MKCEIPLTRNYFSQRVLKQILYVVLPPKNLPGNWNKNRTSMKDYWNPPIIIDEIALKVIVICPWEDELNPGKWNGYHPFHFGGICVLLDRINAERVPYWNSEPIYSI